MTAIKSFFSWWKRAFVSTVAFVRLWNEKTGDVYTDTEVDPEEIYEMMNALPKPSTLFRTYGIVFLWIVAHCVVVDPEVGTILLVALAIVTATPFVLELLYRILARATALVRVCQKKQ